MKIVTKLHLKTFVAVLLFTLIVSPAFAFLYEIPILSKEEISKLSDKEIIDVYMEVKIEEIASSEFHKGAGFSNAKEYNKRKALLRFIIDLRMEMDSRELGVPPIGDWLR